MRWYYIAGAALLVGVGVVFYLRRRGTAPARAQVNVTGAPVRTTSADGYGQAVIAPDPTGKTIVTMEPDPYGSVLSNRFGILAPRVSVPPMIKSFQP